MLSCSCNFVVTIRTFYYTLFETVYYAIGMRMVGELYHVICAPSFIETFEHNCTCKGKFYTNNDLNGLFKHMGCDFFLIPVKEIGIKIDAIQTKK